MKLGDPTRLAWAITENTTLGLCVLDERAHCSYLNAAAERILGLSQSDIVLANRPLHDLVHHTRTDGSRFERGDCPLHGVFPRRARETGEEVFVRPDGSFYPIRYSASPLIQGREAVRDCP